MGGFANAIELEQTRDDCAPASEVWSAVRGAVTGAWREALSAEHAEAACAWVEMGSDSLLMIGGEDPDDANAGGDEPASGVMFWFYETVDWALPLAEHWLAHALVSRRGAIERALGELGYALAEDSGYPTAESLSEQRFIVDGARVGHPDSEGVFWQLPESEYTDYADMEEEQRAAALRVRDGGPCKCPYCAARS